MLTVYEDALQAVRSRQESANTLKQQIESDKAQAQAAQEEKAANSLNNALSANYPNARGLFTQEEFLSPDNAYGKVAMGAVAESGWAIGVGKTALSAMKNPQGQLDNFAISVPNEISGKDRQVTVTKPANYENQETNLRVSTGAEDITQYLKLKASLVGKEISDGHAFSKHVIKQGEFKNVNVSTREQFEKHVEYVVNNYTSFKELSNGRSAYWHEASGTVVIRNPKTKDGGTAFQPKDGRKYFDEKLK
ncbi:hypothetical protein A4G17_02530 [Frederiksenia canicola]|uniref:Uncharacterized protein n=1 Tax=Frederiksenia canicola TaxID=123824 RepID=A0AAE6X3Y2_9PAST|nr:hypothetical protein A4G17_02530 [Frederiksenia canicola]RPE91986.1 hypothetical protein EDC49_1785 [Frederiksenia canicola]